MKSLVVVSVLTASLVSASAWAATAEQTYKGTCFMCHDAGVSGAPKLGDKAAWAPRIKQGKEALYKVALNGKPGTAMIAKGGNSKITDAEAKAVVDYMIAKAK